ncbi:hypothetical protein [Ruegeria sp. MALMAid1280]|uniref:hypothetical protein n=1 Tax=Ruegeria sp. MALMAid1280 TaxID=3411634 RepID=UPI003B9E5ADC
MPRTTHHTIQGFLYQFLKTLKEILAADNDQTITVEGIVKDIEVVSPSTTMATLARIYFWGCDKTLAERMIRLVVGCARV